MSSLLGIPDGEISRNAKVSWDTSKIGGEPNWMLEKCELPVCSVCGLKMKLVIQVYCPLKDSVYHRVLYISTCPTKSCWNKPHSWKVQRSQVQDESSKTKIKESSKPDSWGVQEDDWGDSTATVTMETKDWCDDADDWGDEDASVTMTTKDGTNENNSNSNVTDDLQFKQMNIVDDISDDNSNHSDETQQMTDIFQSEAPDIDRDSVRHVFELLATSDNSHRTEQKTDFKSEQSPFDSYYLSVVDESDFQTENIQVDGLLKNYEKESGSDLKSLLKSQSDRVGSGSGEEYEKSEIKGDKHSHKFLKRLKRFPDQCIRYEWNGQPMFITKPSKDQQRDITCPHCKSQCVFELQLMPPLVNFLHNSNGDGSEFGTVIIYTCRESCWSLDQKLLEETCLVQSDPDSHLFKI